MAKSNKIESLKISITEAKRIQKRFRNITLISITIIIIGVLSMMYFEGWGLVDSVYFSVVSLTTVGYGDLTPDTQGGKLFVVFYLLVGIAIIAALVNNIIKSIAARKTVNENSDKK